MWRAGWLGGLFIVVGPGGRISTVDCSRVLNVNMSLYGSTSRGRAQRVVLRAQRARPVRGPDLNYHRGSCLRLIVSMVVLPGRLHQQFPCILYFCDCLSASVQWELKNFLKTWFPRVDVVGGLFCRSCCLFLYAAAAFLGLGFWLIRGIGF